MSKLLCNAFPNHFLTCNNSRSPDFYSSSKHSCPAPSRPKAELFPNAKTSPLGNTEYKTIFLKHAGATPRESLRPPQKAITRDASMSRDTTNRVDFVPHPVTPLTPKPPALYKRPEGKINGESEYIKEFQYKTPEPVKPVLPQPSQIRTNNEKFFGKSTQATDFTPYEIQPRVFYGENRGYQPPTEKFEGTSTFQSDFKGTLAAEPTVSMKPAQETKLSRDPFHGTSCYNTDFKRFQIPERYQHPKQLYKPPDDKFTGISSFKSDFPGHRNIAPAQSLKPPMNAKVSRDPLDSMTINRVSYQKWELPPRFSRPPTSYEPPKEKFSSKTVFSDDYVSYGIQEPVSNFKPKHETIKVTAPLEHQTVNRTDFQPIDLSQRTPLVVRERRYVPPFEKFEGQSTTSTAYQGQFTLPAPSAKPVLKPYSKGVKFEGNSTYKQCYSHLGIKPECIAGDPMMPTIHGYKFSYEDPRSGHKFYVPEEKPPCPPAPPPAHPAALGSQTEEIPAC